MEQSKHFCKYETSLDIIVSDKQPCIFGHGGFFKKFLRISYSRSLSWGTLA